MHAPALRTHQSLRDLAPTIQDADLIAFRGSGPVARLIQAAGRSSYSHVGLAVWCCGSPFVAEVRELRGGRIVSLESQVARYPGQIDVYRTGWRVNDRRDGFDRDVAAAAMASLAGREYGYLALAWASLRHLAGVRLFVPAVEDDALEIDAPPYCSAAVSWALRRGGMDPVHNLPDALTEPGDLARSPVFSYAFTLEP